MGILQSGPRIARDIWTAAEPLGLSPKMLRAARKPLRIRTIRIDPFKSEQQSWWLLPGQELPADLRDTPAAQWDEEMQKLESRWRLPTPLEDLDDR